MGRFLLKTVVLGGAHPLRGERADLCDVLRAPPRSGDRDVPEELQSGATGAGPPGIGLERSEDRAVPRLHQGNLRRSRPRQRAGRSLRCTVPGLLLRQQRTGQRHDRPGAAGDGQHRCPGGHPVVVTGNRTRHGVGAAPGHLAGQGRHRFRARRAPRCSCISSAACCCSCSPTSWGIVPVPHYTPFFDNPVDWAGGLVLAWVALALLFSAIYARLSRAQMLETLSEDFIRTARAKGVPRSQVYGRHALRAAITPLVTDRRPGHRRGPGRNRHHRDNFRPAGPRPDGGRRRSLGRPAHHHGDRAGRRVLHRDRESGGRPALRGHRPPGATRITRKSAKQPFRRGIADVVSHARVDIFREGNHHATSDDARCCRSPRCSSRRASGCSQNSRTTGATGTSAMTSPAQTGVIATDPDDSLGPAAEVPGATKGGTITIIREAKISHLDPQRVYSFAGLMNAPAVQPIPHHLEGRRQRQPDPGRRSGHDAGHQRQRRLHGVGIHDQGRAEIRGRPTDHLEGHRLRHRPVVRPGPDQRARPTSRNGCPAPRSTTRHGTSRRTRRRCRRA